MAVSKITKIVSHKCSELIEHIIKAKNTNNSAYLYGIYVTHRDLGMDLLNEIEINHVKQILKSNGVENVTYWPDDNEFFGVIDITTCVLKPENTEIRYNPDPAWRLKNSIYTHPANH